jgi:hypothetical protein
MGSGPAPGAWTKCNGTPSTVARRCANAFIARSCARQSYPSRQWATSSSRYPRSVP